MLEEEGYNVDIKEISPHQYGIPRIRYRVYIVASLKPLEDISKRLKLGRRPKKIDLKSVLLTSPPDYRPVPMELMEKIDAWQEFLDLIPKEESFPLPLWGMEFGATYPFEDTTPFIMSLEELRSYRGSFGHKIIAASDKSEALSMLPSYARTSQERFPEWKVKYIRNSRDFFLKHKDLLAGWSEKIEKFQPSYQKFEWNCHEKNQLDEDRRLSNYVVQLRPSGIRVKRPSTSPALVAMNMTQVPIIMWENRYISPSECKRLQSMDKLKYLPSTRTKAYSSLGNAVNVAVARRVALALVGRACERHARVRPKVKGRLESVGIEARIMGR
jgi:DNA (cytosine-5)-methyltransferase 1